jgi:hypothetical protein
MDPGSEKIKIRIRDEYFGSYLRELRNNFWVKILKFFDADADPGFFFTLDPGWKKLGSIIRDKHPESATLLIRKAGYGKVESQMRIRKESATLVQMNRHLRGTHLMSLEMKWLDRPTVP